MIALWVAAVYGVLLIVAGFLAPVYHWTSESSAGDVTQEPGTLVEVNGSGVVVVLGAPLLATVLVGWALRLRPRRGALPSA
jgi:hypothetical protein